MFSGVLISFKIGLETICAIITIIIPIINESVILLPAYIFIARLSPAPNFCETGIVNPPVNPSAVPIINPLIGPIQPTAARASSLIYLPTIMLSIRLYEYCKSALAIMGKAKIIMDLTIPPLSILFFISCLCIKDFI